MSSIYQDAYLVGIEHSLDLGCNVDASGRLDSNVKFEELRGLPVLSPETSWKVLRMLGESTVLKSAEIIHSYPYDWRTNKPVVIKASLQWFIDTKTLQKKALGKKKKWK